MAQKRLKPVRATGLQVERTQGQAAVGSWGQSTRPSLKRPARQREGLRPPGFGVTDKGGGRFGSTPSRRTDVSFVRG